MITGEIVQVSPTIVKAGTSIEIDIDYYAFNPGAKLGWYTELIASFNGYSNSDINTHGFGDEIQRKQRLNLGKMPAYTLKGTVKLQGRGIFQAFYHLHTFPFIIYPMSQASGDTPQPTPPKPTPVPPPPSPIPLPVAPKPTPFPPLPPMPPVEDEAVEKPLVPEDKKVWLWVGLAVVGVVVVGMMVVKK